MRGPGLNAEFQMRSDISPVQQYEIFNIQILKSITQRNALFRARVDGRPSQPPCYFDSSLDRVISSPLGGTWPILPTKSIIPSDAQCCHMGTAIKHPVPDRVKQSFVIFDIRAL